MESLANDQEREAEFQQFIIDELGVNQVYIPGDPDNYSQRNGPPSPIGNYL